MKTLTTACLAASMVALAGCPPGSEGTDQGIVGVAITPTDPTSSDDLVATPLDDQGIAAELGSFSVSWQVNGVDAGANAPTLAAAATTRGESWVAVLSDGTTNLTSAPVDIGNSPPSISEVQIEPQSPGSDAEIGALVAGWADADGDGPTYLFEWMVGGEVLEGQSGTTLPAYTLSRGDILSLRVTPDDGFDLGVAVTSSEVTIGNGAPYAPDVTLTPAEPQAGIDDLVCTVDTSVAADPDGDACTYEVRWILDGSAWPDPGEADPPQPTTTTLDGDTVPADQTQDGQNWTCRVVANDGELDGPAGEASVYLATGPVADWSLEDVNATSPTTGQSVSPRDYLQKVSGWYFGHAT